MQVPTALVLFAHGARDPAWAAPLERLAIRIAGERPGIAVRIAFLELQVPELAHCLDDLASAGIRRIDVAPVFWSQGGHIVQDLARIIGEFRTRHIGVHVAVLPVLAELPGMDQFLAQAILGAIKE